MINKRGKITVFRLVYVVVLAAAMVLLSSALFTPKAYSLAGINQQLSFEGKVVNSNGTNITDGNYNVEFQIWNGASCNPTTGSGCSAIWTEDYLTSNGTYATTVPVTFTSGTYQVNLGSICAFTTSSCEGNSNTAVNWNTYPLYLSINVGTTGVCATSFSSCGGGTGVMYPLIALTSSPYSFNSNELGGLTSSQYGQIAANNTFTGSNTLQPTSNTATALQLENTDGESILQGGTSAPTNYITDADFNTASVTTCVGSSTFTDWTVVGSPTHFCYNNTPANTYEGATSLEEVLAAGSEGFETPGSSAGLTSAPTTNNSADEYYTVSFEAMQTAGTAVAANTFTITAVDATGNQTCTGQIRGSGTNTLSASGFQTVYCTLQFTSGSAGSITQLEVQDSATSGTFYFDAMQLQLATTSSTSAVPSAYYEGLVNIRGIDSSPLSLQNVTNSSTAFQLQTAAGSNVLAVSTLNGGNTKVTNNNSNSSSPTIATAHAAWTTNGGVTTLTVAPQNVGDVMMLAIYTTGGAVSNVSGGGPAIWNLIGTGSIPAAGVGDVYYYEGTITSTASTTITFTYAGSVSANDVVAQEFDSAYGSNTQWSIIAAGSHNNASSTTDTFPSLTSTSTAELYWGYSAVATSYVTGTGCTAGFTCTQTASSDAYIYDASLAATTGYTPSITLGSAGISTSLGVIMSASYGSGNAFTVNGTANVVAASQTAFLIQNSSANGLLTADTTDMRVIVGSGPVGEATPALLALDNSTTAADPTGFPGAMYYNAVNQRFRCYQQGAWMNCAGFDGDGATEAGFMEDEFLAASTSAGTNIWTCAAITAGTFVAAATTVGHIGVDVAASAAANEGYECSDPTAIYKLGGGETMDLIFSPVTTTNSQFRFGFGSTAPMTNALPTDYCFALINATVSGQCLNGTADSTQTSSPALTLGSWYHVRVQINSNATGCTFTLYNMAGTILWSDSTVDSASIPTQALTSGFTAYNTGGAVTIADIDAMSFYYTGFR